MHINSLTSSAKQIKIIIDNKNKHIIKKNTPLHLLHKRERARKKMKVLWSQRWHCSLAFHVFVTLKEVGP